ncbi:dihydroneopterin aldolase [Aquisediminimonas profunda]|uniref:dihydroneopterin aldolase n=1 Tax=Aquisediminimonas profunda TaxID=1550733 RepID=UPI001FED1557|nr:dihydroneopterin aldolase [Aquisediminimonas profunda]
MHENTHEAAQVSGMACLTRVRVQALGLLVNIGINPDEIGRHQPLVISVEIVLRPAMIEYIADTVDYRRIVKAAEVLATTHVPLIECFAQRLAQQCLFWPGADQVTVTADKPFALPRGQACTELTTCGAAIAAGSGPSSSRLNTPSRAGNLTKFQS